MDCPEVREEFSALLDGELAPEARAAIEAHLSECSDCLRALEKLKRVDVLYRGLPAKSVPEGFGARVREAVRPRLFRFPRRRFERKALWPVLAAAAMLVVLAGAAYVQLHGELGLLQVAKEPARTAQQRHAPKYEVPEHAGQPGAPAVGGASFRGRSTAAGTEEVQPGFAETLPPERVAAEKVVAEVASARPPVPGDDKEALARGGYLGKGVDMDSAPAVERKAGGKPAPPGPTEPIAKAQPAEPAEMPAPPALSEALTALAAHEESLAVTESEPRRSAVAAPRPAAAAVKIGAQSEAEAKRDEFALARRYDAGATGPKDGLAVSEEFQAQVDELLPKPESFPAAELEQRVGVQDEPIALGAVSAAPDTGSRGGAGGYGGYAGVGERLRIPASYDGQGVPDAPPLVQGGEPRTGSATVAGREFELRDGVWRQKGYKSEPTTVLIHGSRELRRLTRRHPELAKILALGDRVVFRIGDTWYKVQPKSE